MQKKLIAVALLGLSATVPAMAQSNVTIYGVVDMGYTYYRDNVDSHIGSMSAIQSGQNYGSRLGFKGTEDLGNGLKALFTLETGIAVDTGSNNQGGLSWGRQSFVGLTSNSWGTVVAGRIYTPQFNLWANVDPFELGTVGESNNINVVVPRLDNTVAYITPSWSGFNVTLAYATNAAGAETAGNDKDSPVWAISPVYSNGPLMVGANYHQIKVKNTLASDYKIKNWDIGATYDFKVAKLALGYTSLSDSGSLDLLDNRGWMIGVTVPVGKAKILASYNDNNDKTAANQDAHQWAIGVSYPFSKRTDIYAVYSDISNKNSGRATVSDATNDGMGYQTGVQFGIRHLF